MEVMSRGFHSKYRLINRVMGWLVSYLPGVE
jgi:hypothetical protein